MLEERVVFILTLVSFLISYFLRINENHFLSSLVLFWFLHLVYNIFSRRILRKKKHLLINGKGEKEYFYPRKNLFLYLEELISLVFLIPLFLILKINILYPFAIFGFAEIIIAMKNIFFKKSKTD